MVNFRCILFMLSFCWFSGSYANELPNPGLTTGVSRQLAVYRKTVLSNINYKLQLDIPSDKKTAIPAIQTIKFKLKSNQYPLQLDFRENIQKLKTIKVNGKSIPVSFKSEHIIIAVNHLKIGSNTVDIVFDAGDGALNRNNDYLYTLFVPDRARTVFPCFDQPDLKATYDLTLKLPADWKAMANAALKDSLVLNDRKTYVFKTSDLLSTYLFAFAAGKFNLVKGKTGSMDTDFLYRETDSAKISHSVDEVFNIHSNSLKYFEEWTGIPYPFQKFDYVAIPDFQFGGMEHAGAIQYKASSLFLDAGATKDQLNARTNLIAHETAHMWFGDLVTMTWFTDVWMKEVFANFMADKSTESEGQQDVFDLKFLVDHFPAAYGVDRTTGSNPIRQQLDNLKDAGTMYGNIIYHKAPIMMRQLERLMGKERFQQGVREYLKKFANSNASWPDLIAILDKYAVADLKQWDKVWVNETGRPVIDYTIKTDNNKISKFTIKQSPEYGNQRIWPQLFEMTFFYPNYSKEITINLNSPQIELTELNDTDAPLFVLFNSSGQGYGLWPVDQAMLSRLYSMDKPLSRASAYISLYENMLNGRAITPLKLLHLFVEGLDKEKEELNLRLISNYISTIYWEFINAEERSKLTEMLEKSLWAALELQSTANNKKVLFKTYQDVFSSKASRDVLYGIWNTKKTPEGLKLTEDDYIALSFALALRDDEDKELLNKQLALITNTDRKKRFEFIMPALSGVLSERDAFFKSLELKSNREKESNVGAALYYLHHPLRQATSVKYLEKSLDMLTEIQTTGDIFFPQNWLQSTLGYYQSKEAAAIVRSFLQRNPVYNPKLKAKILQAADNLFRAEVLCK